jgi:hypothetical protein
MKVGDKHDSLDTMIGSSAKYKFRGRNLSVYSELVEVRLEFFILGFEQIG